MSISLAFAPASRKRVWCALICLVAINMLAWQGALAQNAQQQQATFTLSPAEGNCKPVTGYGAHFPPGSTVSIEGPYINGRAVAGVGDNVSIEKQVAADGTFAVTFTPCPRQLVTGAGNFPVTDGLQFTFTAAVPAQSGVGDAAVYTVSGLGNAQLPSTGIVANGVGVAQLQTSPFAIVLVAAMASVALGACLLLLERARHS